MTTLANRLKELPLKGTPIMNGQPKPKRKEKPKGQLTVLYFYRPKKASSNYRVTDAPPQFVLDFDGRYVFKKNIKAKFDYEFCRAGLIAFGLHTLDVSFGKVVKLELRTEKSLQETYGFKVEHQEFKEIELHGQSEEALKRLERIKRVEEKGVDDEDELDDDDDDESEEDTE